MLKFTLDTDACSNLGALIVLYLHYYQRTVFIKPRLPFSLFYCILCFRKSISLELIYMRHCPFRGGTSISSLVYGCTMSVGVICVKNFHFCHARFENIAFVPFYVCGWPVCMLYVLQAFYPDFYNLDPVV